MCISKLCIVSMLPVLEWFPAVLTMTEVCQTRLKVEQLSAKHIIVTAGSFKVEPPTGLDVSSVLF